MQEKNAKTKRSLDLFRSLENANLEADRKQQTEMKTWINLDFG